MYVEEVNKNIEIEKVEAQIDNLEKTKVIGPDLIKKLEKDMVENPANMEECQFKINYIYNVLMNYEAMMKSLTFKLNALLLA